MLPKCDSVAVFNRYFITWKILGFNIAQNRYLCRLYDVILSIVVTICFPLHLTLGVFYSQSKDEFFSNLVISASCVACSIKHVIYRRKLRQMIEINDIFQQLDQRIQFNEEKQYFRNVMRGKSHFMMNFFSIVFGSVGSIAIVSVLVGALGNEWKLMYPAFIPFDWQASVWRFLCVVAFQFFGLAMQTVQNLSNDLYGPITLCLLAGHVHLLALRTAKVGYDEGKSDEQHLAELTDCIKDFTQLMSIYKTVGNIISMSYFTQFATLALNICIAVVYVLFFAEDLFAYAYYASYIIAITVELFPCCYYAAILEHEFRILPNGIVSCNWPMQQRPFRRNIIIFTELSQKEVKFFAGGLIQIHLGSFIVTCKMAYSLFTVIQRMK